MRRQTLKFLAMFMVAAIVFSGCKKEQLVDTVMTISGIVRDYNGTPMEGVKVVVGKMSATDTTTQYAVTKAGGVFQITGIKAGSYMLSYSKDGFAKMVSILNVTNTSEVIEAKKKDDPTYSQYQDGSATMYPLLGSLKGKVTLDGIRPVKDAKVVVKFENNSNFDVITYTATTDAEGNYMLEKLPLAYANLYVYTTDPNTSVYNSNWIKIFSEGSPQEGNSNTMEITLSDTRLMKLLSASFFTYVNDGGGNQSVETKNVVASADLVLNFNQTLDQTKTFAKDGYVRLRDNNYNIIDVTVAMSGKTLTINPNGDLKKGETYSIEWKVYSTDDLYSIDLKSFTVAPDAPLTPAALTGLKDANADSKYDATLKRYDKDGLWKENGITLQFDKSANATHYYIYAKGSKRKTEFYKIDTYTPNLESGYTAYQTYIDASLLDAMKNDIIGSAYPLSDNEVTFKVVPVYSKDGFLVMGTEQTLTIKDAISAKFNSSTTNDYGYDNTSGTTDDTQEFTLTVTEPCVVTSSVNFTPKKTGTNDELLSSNISYVWISNTQIEFTVKIPAGKNYNGNEITISGLQDKSGVSPDPTKVNGTIVVKLNN